MKTLLKYGVILSVLWSLSAVLQAQSTPLPDGPRAKAGTHAADGIGVAVGPTRSTEETFNAPWEEDSVDTPLKAGDKMTAHSIVQTMEGEDFDLNAAVASQPTVLIFYRGGWCPYCNAHLRELQTSAPALQAMGYQILAVSTDMPEALKETADGNELSYQLFADPMVTVADSFGLKYKVKQNYLDHLTNDHDTDLVAQNGGYLLTPGAYIMNTDGVIEFAYVNMNFAVRISQDALLKAAREALN